ncbi:MAG TPA: hypothetical protein EYG93_00325 [Sulfurospirillum arcachonense]|nr:hypothetical protein [Sulfurospirillum arcachonense]HIP43769.1 hypothetical protein [Sulfurospirillum arcachonense]
MKAAVEYFSKKGVLFKSFKEIDKTLLKTRKKVVIFASTDTKGNYHSVFKIEQKSRFLIKNTIELVELEEKLQQLEKHNFKYKHLIIGEAICSKSINYLKERGWQLHHDFM